jgi:hypothetical protein
MATMSPQALRSSGRQGSTTTNGHPRQTNSDDLTRPGPNLGSLVHAGLTQSKAGITCCYHTCWVNETKYLRIPAL